MSDRVTHSYSDCDGRTGKSIHSVQSVWMAHWTRTSYNATADTHAHAPIALGNKENDQDSKPLRSIVKLETMSSKLSKSVKRLRESETQTFEVINENLRTSSRTIAKETLGNWSLPLHSTCENVKTQSYDIGRSIVSSRPLLDNPSHLASHLVPYREGEKTQKPFISRSFLSAKEEEPRPGVLTPYLRQNDSFLLDAPSTSRKLLPEFGGEEFQKTPGGSFIRFLKNDSSPSQVTESKELHHRSYDQQKLPHPLLDVDRMRITNTMGCVRNAGMWSEINGKASLSDYEGGMKLQFLDCSTGSERKENNIEGSKPSEFVLKNESSAETDTMDMDVFQEKNQLCGTSSSIVKKVNKMDQNSPPRLALDFSKKEAGRKQFKLDINVELPAPTDNMEASSSRTESLDLGSILARAERPSSSRTDLYPEGLLGQDLSSRWVKRLKVRASGSLAFGTKSSSLLGERETSPEKSHKFLSKITQAKTIANSELASSKRHGKELMAHNSTSLSVIKKDLELLTSHSWIQRLLHNRVTTAQNRPQPVVVCEPQSSKLELDDFQKKQFPSLDAMALMGKAMNGFQPCEFHRKGPLVVWNTRSF